ncbi:putative WRKY transcription factor 23 [Raphanus sativus]|uniref:WRKY transcription factor 23 n=1 Tax=Raphanus sativus TaxID=3726 RepID=A0A6J0N3G8_RAPSA|nr:WRKY transcription factor 23 [Raphanus sativus]XP_056863688.1 WRKY transcription factor 23-like [Raphanus sativus]KAJ4872393.1 putative WRKY transcription factor 23 [Raphanus sativus]KAJ4904382.1 putative WRKY transcription factor 23 [Raphanus sativus]
MEFTSFYHPSSLSVWDLGDFMGTERDSFELLGSQQHHQFQDYASPHSLLLETLQPQMQPFVKLPSADSMIFQAPLSNATADKSVTSRVETLCSDHLLINSPATPNSSSISSASSEAVNEEKAKRVDQEEEEGHTKSDTNKQLKPKKNSLKRQREARVAFMTKSEVDHLEDGYRWRKYGQKAVKNSPFPRSYYRCTTASCNVKKRVERSFRDPSTVVTTYEGQHTHISPLTSRPISTGGFFGSSGVASNLGGNFGFPMERSTVISPQFQQLVHYHQQQQQQELLSCFGGVGQYLNSHTHGYGDDERVKKSRGLVKDNGLLQDVVPCHMLKED